MQSPVKPYLVYCTILISLILMLFVNAMSVNAMSVNAMSVNANSANTVSVNIAPANVQVQPIPLPHNALKGLVPNTQQTLQSIALHPYVNLAQHDNASEQQMGQITSKGTNAWHTRVGMVERRISEQNYQSLEGNINLERTFRWPAKVALSKKLGTLKSESGELIMGDAWHESAKQIHERWFDYIKALNEAELITAYLKSLQYQIDITQKRINAGELPKMDRFLIQTEFFNQQARLINQMSMVKEKHLALSQIYKGTIPNEVQTLNYLPVLLKLKNDLKPVLKNPQWVFNAIEHNHELELAINKSEQARKNYEITQQQRIGDPTIGGGFFNEQRNTEKLYALNVSIPIGQPSHKNEVSLASSQYQKSLTEVNVVRSNLQLLLKSQLTALDNAATQLQYATDQLAQYKVQNQVVNKAYTLGEIDINGLILNQRQNIDVNQRLTNAEIDFIAYLTLLYINTHELWMLDDEHAHNKKVENEI